MSPVLRLIRDRFDMADVQDHVEVEVVIQPEQWLLQARLRIDTLTSAFGASAITNARKRIAPTHGDVQQERAAALGWAPDPGDACRRGEPWSGGEWQALVDEFERGDNAADIAKHHLRSEGSIYAALIKRSLLQCRGGNYYTSCGNLWS